MKRYHVTTRLGDRTIAFEEPLDDPFVRHTVVLGWRDLLRGLLRGELPVTVLIGGDREIVNAVMNLPAEPLAVEPQDGLSRVQEAVRRARGGEAPPTVQGFA